MHSQADLTRFDFIHLIDIGGVEILRAWITHLMRDPNLTATVIDICKRNVLPYVHDEDTVHAYPSIAAENHVRRLRRKYEIPTSETRLRDSTYDRDDELVPHEITAHDDFSELVEEEDVQVEQDEEPSLVTENNDQGPQSAGAATNNTHNIAPVEVAAPTAQPTTSSMPRSSKKRKLLAMTPTTMQLRSSMPTTSAALSENTPITTPLPARSIMRGKPAEKSTNIPRKSTRSNLAMPPEKPSTTEVKQAQALLKESNARLPESFQNSLLESISQARIAPTKASAQVESRKTVGDLRLKTT